MCVWQQLTNKKRMSSVLLIYAHIHWNDTAFNNIFFQKIMQIFFICEYKNKQKKKLNGFSPKNIVKYANQFIPVWFQLTSFFAFIHTLYAFFNLQKPLKIECEKENHICIILFRVVKEIDSYLLLTSHKTLFSNFTEMMNYLYDNLCI